ncbi:hypothetical protein PoB_006087100 [Plakobranchus ocellatus]|uniref:Uncharacterized protein n=1 Tax=Plakobranchus ocellatus TaxID=259542 RepID=A0AAV4CRE9_9GAST|nr:hypothetical protein PoB_006087100 [Plakobranchus ocellatus]
MNGLLVVKWLANPPEVGINSSSSRQQHDGDYSYAHNNTNYGFSTWECCSAAVVSLMAAMILAANSRDCETVTGADLIKSFSTASHFDVKGISTL